MEYTVYKAIYASKKIVFVEEKNVGKNNFRCAEKQKKLTPKKKHTPPPPLKINEFSLSLSVSIPVSIPIKLILKVSCRSVKF